MVDVNNMYWSLSSTGDDRNSDFRYFKGNPADAAFAYGDKVGYGLCIEPLNIVDVTKPYDMRATQVVVRSYPESFSTLVNSARIAASFGRKLSSYGQVLMAENAAEVTSFYRKAALAKLTEDEKAALGIK